MLPAGIGEFGKSFGLNVGRGKVTLSSAEIIPEVLKSRSFALKILKKQNMILRRMGKIKN